ncbi:MAG: tetratricopeptide repeat protein [Candidatus Zixiibacteriota bacterium]
MSKNDIEIEVCPACGVDMNKKSVFCSACGTQYSKPAGKIKRNKSNTIILGVFVILFGLLYLTLASSPEKATANNQENQMESNMPDDMSQFQAMVDRLPTDYGKLVAMGNKLMDERSYHLAIEAYKRALAIDSTDPNVLTDLGACYHSLGNAERAVQLFEKAIAIDPNHAIAYFNLGIAYRDLNDKDKVRQYWGRLIELYPNQPLADTVKKYLDRLDNY